MGRFVPQWRLREVRNIADALAYRAACCPVSRLLMLAEGKYLWPCAHIQLLVDPGLKVGEASSYVQVMQGARCVGTEFEVNLFEATIYFNGDLTSKKNWEKTTRSIVKELGWVIFFSPAARYQVLPRDEKRFLRVFVDAVLSGFQFKVDSTRPRFTLAKLRQIVEEELNPQAKEVLEYMPKLLRPYLGPDGW